MGYVLAIIAAAVAVYFWAKQPAEQDIGFMKSCEAVGGKFTPFIDPKYSYCDYP